MTKKQREIEERRCKVRRLRFIYTIEEIAKILGVHVNTIKNDIAKIKENLKFEIASLPKETIPLDFMHMIYGTKHRIADLEERYNNSSDVNQKLAISKEIRENQDHLRDLYDDYPVIYALRSSGGGENAQKN